MTDFDPTKFLSYSLLILVVLFFVGAGLIWVEKRVRWYLQSLLRRDGVDREAVKKTWLEIEEMSESANEYELRQSVVKADSLLDDVLKQKEMMGRDMARRIKFAMHKYPELRIIWKSHRLRNQIVHEHDTHFSSKQLRGALKDYKKVLRALGVL